MAVARVMAVLSLLLNSVHQIAESVERPLELEACGVRVKQAACRRMRSQHRDEAAA